MRAYAREASCGHHWLTCKCVFSFEPWNCSIHFTKTIFNFPKEIKQNNNKSYRTLITKRTKNPKRTTQRRVERKVDGVLFEYNPLCISLVLLTPYTIFLVLITYHQYVCTFSLSLSLFPLCISQVSAKYSICANKR